MIVTDHTMMRRETREYLDTTDTGATAKPRSAPRSATPRTPGATPRELAAPAPAAPVIIPAGAGGGITVNAPKVPETPTRAAAVTVPAPAAGISPRMAAVSAGAVAYDPARTTLALAGIAILVVLFVIGVMHDD